MKQLLVILTVTFLLAACGNEDYTPKPRIYPKMDLPKQAYKTFEKTDCSFTFQQPVATQIEEKDSEKPTANEFNLYYPALNGAVYFTYYPITKEYALYELVADAYEMEDQHLQKASFMDHSAVIRPDANVFGEITDIGGDVGTPFQFYLTDSTTHFIRGALTFNATANSDSLAPALQYVKKDMMTLIESFQWK